MTGDFNAGESNPAIRYLKGEIPRASSGGGPVPASPRLIDSFRALHPDATGVGTFNGFQGTTTGEKIDYVFVDRGWGVLEARIISTSRDNRFPSDHFPVSAVLDISGGNRVTPGRSPNRF